MKIFIVLTLFSSFLFMSDGYGHAITISKIQINCLEGNCANYLDRFEVLKRDYLEEDDLKDNINVFLNDRGIKKIDYNIDQNKLNLELSVRSIINEIRVDLNNEKGIDKEDLKKIILIKANDYFLEEINEKSIEYIDRYFREKGYESVVVNFSIVKEKNKEILQYNIQIDSPIRLKEMTFKCDSMKRCHFFLNKVNQFIGKTYNGIRLNDYINDINNRLIEKGYLFSTYEINKQKINENEINIKINFKEGDLYRFYIRGQAFFSYQELREMVKETALKSHKSINQTIIMNRIKSEYEKHGIYNTEVSVDIFRRNIKVESDYSVVENFYIIKIIEGHRIKIKEINFQGDTEIGVNLKDLFYQKAPKLVQRDFYQKDYILNFVEEIKKIYYQKGHLFVNVSEPSIRISDKKDAKIAYKIREGEQTLIRKIKMDGVSPEMELELKSTINNKEDAPINIFNIQKDIDLIETKLAGQGHYYSKVLNIKPSDHLLYDEDFKRADIKYNIFLDEKIVLDKIIISGNSRTKDVVISREIYLSSGDIITNKDIDLITERLNALAIFSDVNISLLRDPIDKKKVNFLVTVKEKDSGVIELAPGYRTDLGLKLSFGVAHNNISGMNRTLSFKGQANQRLNLESFNQERNRTLEKKIEHQTNINFLEPYFLGYPVSSLTTGGFSSKRYYKYDAEELKIKTQFTKQFNDIWSASLQYQLESIVVEGSQEEEDNGYFRIGSITPGTSLDFRDDPVYPTRGAFFDLSFEYAHPNLYSQNRLDYEINYYKLVSYNNFYFDMGVGILATSWALGIQEDLVEEKSKKQRIPKFKVFRLNGIDMVRGYRDEEINRLETGADINDTQVDNRAYFSNIKIEPRFYWDDNIMLGPFFDAGRIFVNKFKPLDLRYSVGVSLKFLTPVGPIDLSYGLKPKRLPNESLGQLTLSIGPF